MGTWELGSEEGQPGNFKGLSPLMSPDVKSPQPLLEKEPREEGQGRGEDQLGKRMLGR